MNSTSDSAQERQDFLKTRVEVVNFTRRVLDALSRNNIRTIAGIVKRSQTELKRLLNLSDKETEEVLERIEELEKSSVNSSIHALDTTPTESDQSKKVSDVLSLSDLGGEADIVAKLSKYLGYSKKTVVSHSREKHIVEVRDLIAYLLREYGAMSYPAIGRLLGGRDHTTIIYSYNKTKGKVARSPELAHKLESLIGTVESIKRRKLRVEQDLIPEILAHTSLERQLSYKEIPTRNTKIFELWREGLTLQNIASDFGITRERVRQIIVATIKQTAVNESASKGIVMDSDILAEEEVKKRHAVQEAKKVPRHPERAQKKEKRWSRYYAACRSCGTTAIPHVRKGLCEQCIGGFRSERREHIISEHKNKCDSCGIGRYEAQASYGRDFYITKTQDVLCRKCFLSRTGGKLASFKRGKR